MFEKFAIFVCCAGIVITKDIHSALKNAPRQILTASPSSAPSTGVSSVQYPIEARVLESPYEARVLQSPYDGRVLQSPYDGRVLQSPYDGRVLQSPYEARVLQSQQIGNIYSPLIYTTQNNVAQYPRNSGVYGYFASPSSSFAIRPAAVTITSASVAAPISNPVLVQQPIQYSQEIVERPAVQYVGRPATGAVVVKEDRPANNLVTDTQKSVTAHSPTRADENSKHPIQSDLNHPAVQYVTAPAIYPVSPYVFNAPQVYYAQANPQANNPVTVPAVYNTEDAVRSQYIAVSNYAQSVPGIRYNAPVSIPQPIAVPLYQQNQAPIRYKAPPPVIYTRPSGHSSADLRTSRPISRSGYSKAFKYSPAPAVSRVSFTGLGVNYGW